MSRRRRVVRRLLQLLGCAAGLVATLMVTAVVLYSTLTDVPSLEDVRVSQIVTIQYSDGSTLARIGEVDRVTVPLARVPPTVRWAFLAAEDRSFYSEPGFSFTGTVRAAWSDLTGGSTQGGSGITQQLVKNTYVGDAESVKRKVRELMIAIKLSRHYSKNTILSRYLNSVYFGRGAYGIQEAARAYFGTTVQQLSAPQGALLAAVLRAPGYYDPAVHPAAARQRWQYVIDGLVATGRLTRARARSLAFPATVRPAPVDLGTTGWKHILVGRVFADLSAAGITADEVFESGMTIRTTIDRTAQAAAVAAVEHAEAGRPPRQAGTKAAVVAVSPASGGVLAYYGGTGPAVRDGNGRVDDVDYAGDGYRLAGATMQPYVLATTLTQTLAGTPGKHPYDVDSVMDARPCIVVDRAPICAPAGAGGVHRYTTVSGAMQTSSTTTFDQLAADAGPDEVAALAHRMGVSTTDSGGGPTLVDPNGDTSFGIGSGLYAVSPLDQATGYATLADGGVRNRTYFVQSATASDGATVFRHRPDPERVLDASVAHDVTLTLGPHAPTPPFPWTTPPSLAKPALAGGRQAAAKSATIQLDGRANSDAWTVGYTPQVAAAVWFGSGYDRPVVDAAGRPMTGTDEPATVWRRFMDTYRRRQPREPLPDHSVIWPRQGARDHRASP